MAEAWTFETLKEHLECQIKALDRRHTELAAERNRAVDAAFAAATEKAKSHNDVLGAMKDQQAAFSNKEQTDIRFGELTRRVGELERNSATAGGKWAGASSLVGYLFAAVTVVLAFVAWANGRLG